MTRIGFFGPDKKNGFLSNFYPSPIRLDDRDWPTVEHYFQAQKFPTDPTYMEQIRQAPSPKEAKRLGGKKASRGHPFHPNWNTARNDVMITALRAKFTQNPSLRNLLLKTGDAILEERSPWDSYWGTAKGGQNMLGRLLMQVRDELRKEDPLWIASKAFPVSQTKLDDGILYIRTQHVTDEQLLRFLEGLKKRIVLNITASIYGLTDRIVRPLSENTYLKGFFVGEAGEISFRGSLQIFTTTTTNLLYLWLKKGVPEEERILWTRMIDPEIRPELMVLPMRPSWITEEYYQSLDVFIERNRKTKSICRA